MGKLGLGTAVGLVSVLAAAVVVTTATPASAETATFTAVNSWNSGYEGHVAVRNDTSSMITTWQVQLTLPAGTTIASSWNTSATASGGVYTFRPLDWNATVVPGASATFGFTTNGTGRPTACFLNGRSCAGGTGPTPPQDTTPPPPQGSNPPPPQGNTPVARHGQLRVCGTAMCDRTGARVQLRGVSSMWLNWESVGYAENRSALTWMRDNWNLTVIRAAMGVEPAGAYLSDPAKARGQVEAIINNAVTTGVYVIVDWHAHEAQNNQSQAVAFFGDLARRYGHLPNVIWETFNEPLQVSWTGVLKPYHQAVLAAIRAADPDNIVILGTPTWSQGVDQAAASPVAGTNLMYTLHFYSCSHGEWLRTRADAAMRAGLALFVTEWGASHADGGLDGVVCGPEAQAWLNWMRTNGVSWTAWKLSVGTDSTNLLANGAPVTGGWNNFLHGHASLVVAAMR